MEPIFYQIQTVRSSVLILSLVIQKPGASNTAESARFRQPSIVPLEDEKPGEPHIAELIGSQIQFDI